MSLFYRYLVRKYLRPITKPIDPAVAKKWYNRLVILYILVAWHAFGYVYFSKKNMENQLGMSSDFDDSSAHYYARITGQESGKIISFNLTPYATGPRKTVEFFDRNAYLERVEDREVEYLKKLEEYRRQKEAEEAADPTKRSPTRSRMVWDYIKTKSTEIKDARW